jgi:hypothetical protein
LTAHAVSYALSGTLMVSNAPNNHARPQSALQLEEQTIKNGSEHTYQAEKVARCAEAAVTKR